MDVKLKPFNFAEAASRAGMADVARRVRQATGDGAANSTSDTKSASGASFSTALGQALRSVSDAQNEATRMQHEVALDNPTVSIEQTMVTMQKAQIGFAAALQVRNRLVQAYSEIMNMQV